MFSSYFLLLFERFNNQPSFFFQVEPSVPAIVRSGNKSWSDVFSNLWKKVDRPALPVSNAWKNRDRKFRTLENLAPLAVEIFQPLEKSAIFTSGKQGGHPLFSKNIRKTDETLRDRLVKRTPHKLFNQRELLCVAEDGAEYKTKGE